MADEQPVHPPAKKPSSGNRPRSAAARPNRSGTTSSGVTPANSPATIPASLRRAGPPPSAGLLLTGHESDQDHQAATNAAADRPLPDGQSSTTRNPATTTDHAGEATLARQQPDTTTHRETSGDRGSADSASEWRSGSETRETAAEQRAAGDEDTDDLPITGLGLGTPRGVPPAAEEADEPTTDLSGLLEAVELRRATEVTDLSDLVRAGESPAHHAETDHLGSPGDVRGNAVAADRFAGRLGAGDQPDSRLGAADRGLLDQDTHDLGRLRVGGYLAADIGQGGARATGGRVPSSRGPSADDSRRPSADDSRRPSADDSRERRGRPVTRSTGGVSRLPSLRLQFQPVVRVVDMAASVGFFELLGAEIIHGERTSDYVLLQLGTIQIRLDRHDLADHKPGGLERHRERRGRSESRRSHGHGDLPRQGRGQAFSRPDSGGDDRPGWPVRGEFDLSFVTAVPLGELEQRLRAEGVTIAEGVHHTDFGAQLHVRTPDGLLIKFGQFEPDGWA